MASGQQKPKSSAQRNSNADRKNGKAWKKNPDRVEVGRDGFRQAGRGLPSGKSICGYPRERVEKWAKDKGITLADMTELLKKDRDDKRIARKEARRVRRISDNASSACWKSHAARNSLNDKGLGGGVTW